MKIMLVDDDPIFNFIARKLIESTKIEHELEEYLDGSEALEAIKQKKSPDELPDRILLDINMPKVNGWQFLEALRHLNISKDVSVTIVTSSIDGEDRRKAFSFPEIDEFLIKPISKKEIAEILNK
ncbi:response regulator [Schleiferia thermophila]|jgi:CheY-like chemotaxis protein|uniref:Response regulator receiver domain-containing protein n=1 Tax=Schleiferia thermophila TaxID=884107 RepID=A0A369AA83_9FLAO|nr:response regulator [Schleiferia thermophila]KFD39909.1 transcriptional regulator [Schleiferia thermophila str. Yellowstone]RCX05308.1 response regulator receiver domain-containing protein [Schleiferia thermophila]GCD79184.1 response regulator [Schleiferia thermophila]